MVGHHSRISSGSDAKRDSQSLHTQDCGRLRISRRRSGAEGSAKRSAGHWWLGLSCLRDGPRLFQRCGADSYELRLFPEHACHKNPHARQQQRRWKPCAEPVAGAVASACAGTTADPGADAGGANAGADADAGAGAGAGADADSGSGGAGTGTGDGAVVCALPGAAAGANPAGAIHHVSSDGRRQSRYATRARECVTAPAAWPFDATQYASPAWHGFGSLRQHVGTAGKRPGPHQPDECSGPHQPDECSDLLTWPVAAIPLFSKPVRQ
mmetsp:Transcript_29248/g.75372  ORF Transcript_29248/g.75372 Transcript_29248/m.75372 type:complete len:268 (+) Transcript_29248:310-1113(+)